MANTRFYRPSDNRIARFGYSGVTPRIINGDTVNYPGAPAKVEDPRFPMSNLNSPDRYTPWMIPVGASSPIYLQFDLGGNLAVGYLGFFAFRCRPNALFSVGFDLGGRLSSLGYTPGPSGYTSIISGTFQASGMRDAAYFAGSPGTFRYWQLTLTPSTSVETYGFKLFPASATPQDLGISHAAGMVDTMVHTAVQSRTGGGNLSVMQVGDTRRLVMLPLLAVTSTTKQKVDATFGSGSLRDPAVWVDRFDISRQVVLANEQLTWVNRWGSPDLWDCELELEVLG